METVVWVVERNFSKDRNHDDWRYWSFPSRYLDEAWSKDWNDAIKMHDRACAENACEDMPDEWNIRILDHQIVDTSKPTYQEQEAEITRLKGALDGVRELMSEEHSYWACYTSQGPCNATLRDYSEAWLSMIDRLIAGEEFEEFAMTDEVNKFHKAKEQP